MRKGKMRKRQGDREEGEARMTRMTRRRRRRRMPGPYFAIYLSFIWWLPNHYFTT
jgi:hypothetical protein